MRFLSLLPVIGLAGCASQPAQLLEPTALPPTARAAVPPAAVPTVTYTRYELGAYGWPRAGDGFRPVMIVRPTRGQTRSEPASPASATFDPLPPSAELAAELTAQKQITADLIRIKASIVNVEKQARDQVGALLVQTDEITRLQRQLESERARVRRLELQWVEQLQRPSPVPPTATTEAVIPVANASW